MAVRITKPAFNIREKLSELDKPAGIIGTQILKTNTLTEFARAAHTGRRNFLRNGAMEVWQRGTSFTNIFNYTADRWQATRYNGTVNQITRGEVNGRVADEMGFNWYLKYGFNGTGGAGAAFINQPLESADSKKLRGKPVCFSFYAKTSSHHAGKRFRSCIGFHTETGAQNDGMYYSGFKTASSTTKLRGYFYPNELWSRYWVTANMPDNVEQIGVSLIDADYDNGDIDITGCQLEIGNAPTPFEHLPYGVEEELCKRYYEVILLKGIASSGYSAGSGGYDNHLLSVAYSVEKRTTPTFTYDAVTNYQPGGGSGTPSNLFSHTKVLNIKTGSTNNTWQPQVINSNSYAYVTAEL